MFQFIQFVIIWTFCIIYSVICFFKLIVLYITKFKSQPWKMKDRPNSPAELIDPKYGVHKFVTVNVSSFDYRALTHTLFFFQLFSFHVVYYSFAQGIRLHYIEAGDPSKPLLVFVHGFPEFWYCWRHQIVEFSKDYWFDTVLRIFHIFHIFFFSFFFLQNFQLYLYFIKCFPLIFRVISIDMRGYNLSERPVGLQNYIVQYLVDDFRALIEYLSKCERT